MQIQRVQSLYLFLAFALMGAFLFTPFGFSVLDVEGEPTTVMEWIPRESVALMIPTIVGALLSLVAIFLYKNFAVQKLLVRLSIISILVTVGVTIYFLVAGFADPIPGEEITRTKWGGGGLLLLAALIADAMALSHISSDERLLRSMDRLR